MKKMSDDGTMTSCEKFTAYRTPNAWELGVVFAQAREAGNEDLGMTSRLVPVNR